MAHGCGATHQIRRTLRSAWIVCMLLLCLASFPVCGCLCNSSGQWTALTALYRATLGHQWLRNGGWPDSSAPRDAVCDWSGVECSASGGLTLNLPDNNLNGRLPDDLAGLHNVAAIFFQNNKLSGSLPSAYSAWGPSVTQFILSNNFITGSLPTDYSNWTDLETFDVSTNLLEGTFPMNYGTAWRRLKNLMLEANRFAGAFPETFGALTELILLTADDNALTGSLPESLSRLTKLTTLRLAFNQFTGTLSPLFANWTSITVVDIPFNKFSGTLPYTFSAWSLASNISFSNNSFTGPLPQKWSEWGASLLEFDVSRNALSGTLPESYQNWSNAERLFFDYNIFSGPVPDAYDEMTEITTFSARNNQLNGTLPVFSSWTRIEKLDVAVNFLSGSLPLFGERWYATIHQLRLQINNFSGALPDQYGDFVSINQLLLGYNRLTGTIPRSFAKCKTMEYFMVSENNLTGTIPLFINAVNWPNLEVLALDGNRFSGTVPASLFAKFFILLHNNARITGTLSQSMPPVPAVSFCNTSLCGLQRPAAWVFTATVCQSSYPFSLFHGVFGFKVSEMLTSGIFVPSETILAPCTAEPSVVTTSSPPRLQVVTRPSRLQGELQTAASRSGAAAVIVSSVLSAIIGASARGVLPSLQVSLASRQIAVRVAKCASGDDDSRHEAGDTDVIGAEIADNPTTLSLVHIVGENVKYPAGAVLGNTLLIVGLPVIVVGVRRGLRKCSVSPSFVAGGGVTADVHVAVAVYLAAWGALHVPTIAASSSLVSHASLSVNEPAERLAASGILGCLGVGAVVCVVCLVARRYAQERPFSGRELRSRRGVRSGSPRHRESLSSPRESELRESAAPSSVTKRCVVRLSGWLSALSQPVSHWDIVGLSTKKTVSQFSGRSLLRALFAQLLAQCLYPHSWVVISDMVSGPIQGILLGIATAPSAGCSIVVPSGWALFAVTFLLAVPAVVLRPRPTRSEGIFQAVMSLWACASTLLAALGVEDGTGICSIAESVLQLLWCVPLIAIYWRTVVASAERAPSQVMQWGFERPALSNHGRRTSKRRGGGKLRGTADLSSLLRGAAAAPGDALGVLIGAICTMSKNK